MKITDSNEDEITTEEDLPCCLCGSAPIKRVYAPVCRSDCNHDPHKLVNVATWFEHFIVNDRPCVLAYEICLNKKCLIDSVKLSPLEKLAAQGI